MSSEGLLDGRYRLIERIGGGGMAEVFLAEDELLTRRVAVKILRSQFTDDANFVSRFRQEARAAARLSHPNIVSIFDVGCEADTHYIVMEYVCGETLKELIHREGRLPFSQTLEIALQIAAALKHAHENKIIHCDIKPHNILINRDGIAKVTDFGIARAVSSQTATQVAGVLGSVHYLSPEQARGYSVDSQSDLYSLGVVLYEMISGAPPFDGATPIAIAMKHLQEDPRPLLEARPDTPAPLVALVEKAMAKKPSERQVNAAALMQEAERVLALLQSETNPLALDRSAARAERRERKVVFALSLKERLRKVPRWAWAIILLLFTSFIVGHFLANGGFDSGKEVMVQDVVGKPAETARSLLQNDNLKVQLVETFDERVAAGYVISQQPAGGQIVKENRTIQLIVSKGTEMAAIPDLNALSRRDAEARIRSAGLKVGRIEEQYSNEVPADTVISQNPRPPGQVAKGIIVDLVVSKGKSPRQIVMPNFQGELLQSVLARIDALHLRAGTVREVTTSRFAPGTVTGQAPMAGSQVFEGTTVDLEVVKSEAGIPKRAKIQAVVPEGPIRQTCQIVVNDANGRRVVYEDVHKPGFRIEKVVEGTGQMTVQVFASGKMIHEQTF